uniref:Putative prohead protease n=3 Tax=viral metagenome TaxID=1070528 RepID=A0A6M3IVX7_9ZZZZ
MEFKKTHFSESISLLEADPIGDGDIWDVKVIKEGLNVSGTREYTPKALSDIVEIMKQTPNQCFVDHPTSSENSERSERSVRELLGWYTDPKLIGGEVHAKLHLLNSGPAASVAAMIKEAAQRGNPSLIGLSIRGIGDNEVVRESGKIFERVHHVTDLVSTDVVTRPGAGGRLISIAENENAELRRFYMELSEMSVEDILKARPDLADALKTKEEKPKEEADKDKKKDEDGYAPPKGEDEDEDEEKKKKKEMKETEAPKAPNLEEANKVLEEIRKTGEAVRQDRCKVMLDKALSESQLPKPVIERMQKQWKGKVFEESEIAEAIASEQSLWDTVLGSSSKREYTPVKITRDERETFVKRLEATLRGEPVDGVEGFSGLIEAYCAFKGTPATYPINPEIPQRILGEANGYDSPQKPRNIQESLTYMQESVGQLSTWSTVLGDAMYRVVLQRYDEDEHDWRQWCTHVVNSKDLRPVYFSRVGGYTMTPAVAEGGTYQEATIPAEEAITADPSAAKYGVLQPVTKEMIIRDDVALVQRIPLELGGAFKERQYQTLMDLMRSNTAVWDTIALANASHSNYSTTALSAASLLTATSGMRAQTPPGATDRLMGIKPKYLFVPPELEEVAWSLQVSDVMVLSSSYNATQPNIFKSKYGIQHQVVDYWTDATNWWLMADPKRPGVNTFGVVVYPNEKPQLAIQDAATAGSVFTADKVTFKVSGYFKVVVLDYRPFFGNIVAG